MTGLSIAVALIGISIARYFYHHRGGVPASFQQWVSPLRGVLEEEWYLDRLYNRVFVAGFAQSGGYLMGVLDQQMDRGVNAVGWLTRSTGRLANWWDEWVIDGAVRVSAYSVKLMALPARLLQTGTLQTYVLFIVIGMTIFLGYLVLAR